MERQETIDALGRVRALLARELVLTSSEEQQVLCTLELTRQEVEITLHAIDLLLTIQQVGVPIRMVTGNDASRGRT